MTVSSPPPLKPDARILLIRLSALGDVVFALPALRWLRQSLPQARIEWVTEDRHEGLLREHPDIDALHIFPRRQGPIPALRSLFQLRKTGPFDAVIDFQANLKSALHVGAVHSSFKLGFGPPIQRERSGRFLHHQVAGLGEAPRARRDAALMEQFLGRSIPEACFQGGPWPISEGLAPFHPGKDPEKIVLLHTGGTAYGRDKAWPDEHWVQLAKNLKGEGHRVELLWTPSDAHQVQTRAQAAEVSLAPATNGIPSLMHLCDQADLLIGTDSGPFHLAAWRGTPALGLYGATDPRIYAPMGTHGHALSALGDEAPPKRQRDRRSPFMDALTPQVVLQKALELL